MSYPNKVCGEVIAVFLEEVILVTAVLTTELLNDLLDLWPCQVCVPYLQRLPINQQHNTIQ